MCNREDCEFFGNGCAVKFKPKQGCSSYIEQQLVSDVDSAIDKLGIKHLIATSFSDFLHNGQFDLYENKPK